MAINKSRTSPLMKLGIIGLAVTFFIGVAAIPLSALLSPAPAPTQSPPASESTTQTVQSINLQHSPQIAAREQSITADPTNYSLLELQGNGYFEWAFQVGQATQGKTGQERPLWVGAATYYARALKVQPGDPNVTTDYSVAQYYSGETTAAIATAKSVIAANLTFAPVVFNTGIFYMDGLGDKVNAKAMFEKYLKLDPNGAQAAEAKKRIATLP
jgi:hypothetical protein